MDDSLRCAGCTDDLDESYRSQIAFELQARISACAPSNPVTQWGLPMPEVSLPPGYRLCLWKTTSVESSVTDLLSNHAGATPGIYLLQALPESLSSASLPTRRLFCRPRPFC